LKYFITYIPFVFLIFIPRVNALTAETPLVVPTLEQLLNTEVQIASRHDESWQTTEAAVFVLTHDDIVRSGAGTIPDCLRLVPGLDVAQINSNTWAVSARGFADRFSNNLLVMVDGRAIYNHLFGGVFWDVQDLLLEDIDRIEVIRGPGAVMWGSNAVNGVINIVTRSARQTQGLHILVGGGNSEKADLSFRWGGALGPSSWVRAWGQYFERGATKLSRDGQDASDGWQARRGGFRMDGESPSGSEWMLQGQGSNENQGGIYGSFTLEAPWTRMVVDNTSLEEGSLQFQWHSPKGEAWEWGWGAYGEKSRRIGYLANGNWTTGDISANLLHPLGKEFTLSGGMETRFIGDHMENSCVQWSDNRIRLWRASLFLQGEKGFEDGLFNLTVGSKLEYGGGDHDDWLGEPDVRLGWKPSDKLFAWGAWSIADRIPSRGENGGAFDFSAFPETDPGTGMTLPVLTRVENDSPLEAVKLRAVDFGVRYAPNQDWSFSSSLFLYSYQDPIITTLKDPVVMTDDAAKPYILQVLTAANGGSVAVWGDETWAMYRPSPRIRLKGWISYFREHYVYPAGTHSGVSGGQTPRWQGNLETYWEPFSALSFDLDWRYVDPLAGSLVPAYQTLDARAAWRPHKDWEVAVVGRNLFAKQHMEFVTPYLPLVSSTVGRSFFISFSRGW
jgi:iron complex outermembrane receptor protein